MDEPLLKRLLFALDNVLFINIVLDLVKNIIPAKKTRLENLLIRRLRRRIIGGDKVVKGNATATKRVKSIKD